MRKKISVIYNVEFERSLPLLNRGCLIVMNGEVQNYDEEMDVDQTWVKVSNLKIVDINIDIQHFLPHKMVLCDDYLPGHVQIALKNFMYSQGHFMTMLDVDSVSMLKPIISDSYNILRITRKPDLVIKAIKAIRETFRIRLAHAMLLIDGKTSIDIGNYDPHEMLELYDTLINCGAEVEMF